MRGNEGGIIVKHLAVMQTTFSISTKSSLFILNRDITTNPILILSPDKIRDLLILRLLDGRLIVLWSLTQDFLLHEIDS